MFKIVAPSYKAGDWLDKCLSSIQNQNNKDYEVCVVDDCSPGDKEKDIIKTYCDKNNWKYLFNVDRKFALYNIYNSINQMNCVDDDVIITVDGDDWLYDENVLDKVKSYYDNYNVYLTYGQFIGTTGGDSKSWCKKPVDGVIKRKLYRTKPWTFTHLRTFKYRLFKHIRVEHLLDRDKSFFKTAWDLALMFPMIEMCGDKFYCSNDILYVYNEHNPLNDFKTCPGEQARCDSLIRRYPVYPTLIK